MIVKLLTEHRLEFLSLKGGCRGLSESTHVKMSHCLKSHIIKVVCLEESLNFTQTCPYQTWYWLEDKHDKAIEVLVLHEAVPTSNIIKVLA